MSSFVSCFCGLIGLLEPTKLITLGRIFQSDLLNNLAFTLSRRSLLKWRVAIPAATSFDLIDALNSNRIVPGKVIDGAKNRPDDLQLGFVFTGQGAQWHAMGRELYGQHGYAVYKTALERAEGCLRKLGAEWSLIEELTGRDAQNSKVSEAHISQPACTAVQLCLVDLLRSWGIRPAAVTGHSSGEIAAAYAAGFITFEAAVAIAYHRGRMIPILKANFPCLEGGMIAVGGSKEEFQPLIDEVNAKPQTEGKAAKIRIACYNSPTSLTISGDSAGIAALETLIKEQQPDTFNRRLQVDVAYHSHQMDLVAKEYTESLAALSPPRSKSNVRFYSSLHGRQINGIECDAKYWVENLTCPVRFCEALDSMVAMNAEQQPGVNMLVELGPHSALQGPIKQILQAAGVAKSVSYISALVRKRDAVETALELSASVMTKGGMIDMDAINFPGGSMNEKVTLLTDLPRYAWNHQSRYWHESRLSKMHTHRGSNGIRGELIGVEAIYSTNVEPTWRNMISLDDLPWLRHHQIQGLVVFPLAGFVVMALEAAAARARKANKSFDAFELRDVDVMKPLAFPPDVVEGGGSIEMTISLRRRHDPTVNEDWDEFRICSWSKDTEWTEHCAGLVSTRSRNDQLATTHRNAIVKAVAAVENRDSLDITATYEHLSEKLGVSYGASFQGIQQSKATDTYAVGRVASTLAAAGITTTSTVLHPTMLESIIEMYWPIMNGDDAKQPSQDTVYLPSSIRHMSIACDLTQKSNDSEIQVYCSASFDKSDPQPTSVNILADQGTTDQEQNLLLSIDGLTVSPIIERDINADDATNAPRELCCKVEWEALENESPDTAATTNGSLTDMEVVIIHGNQGISLLTASQLAVGLEAATGRFPSLEEDLFNRSEPDYIGNVASGKTCVVLTEVNEPFLSHPNEAQFASFQALVASAHKILWITQGAYTASTTPHSNMISGLSRSIRSETTMPFATLDLDAKFDLDSITNVTLNVLRVAFGPSPSQDMEFMYKEGQLFVPRVVNDETMNEFVHLQTDPLALKLQLFGQGECGNRNLRMQFETQTASRTHGAGSDHAITGVHFTDDEAAVSAPLADDEIEFEVKAVGIGAWDVLSIVGDSDSSPCGIQASGIVKRVGHHLTDPRIQQGCRIACFTTAISKKDGCSAFATLARTTTSMVLPLPSPTSVSLESQSAPDFSFEQAAGIPMAYATAYHSLMDQARLQTGQRVLVTCPSDPVGEAAIALVHLSGATVFVAAKSCEEEAQLLQRHQDIVQKNRIVTLAGKSSAMYKDALDCVTKITDGEGFDVVLDLSSSSSASEAHLRKLWMASLARFGCFVQVQEPRVAASNKGRAASSHSLQELPPSSFLDAAAAPKNTCFITVDMLAIATERPQMLKRIVSKVTELLDEGKLRPISSVAVYPFSQAHEAFQVIHNHEAGQQKLVLVPRDDDMVMAPPYHGPESRSILKSDATYLIVGGTGGLGRGMARWMVQNGAGNVVLLSRSANVTPAVEELVTDAKKAGAQILVRKCNVAVESDVSALLGWIAASAGMLPPVRGVVHSAMVLHDVLFEKMNYVEYTAVIESKVQGAWNLHQALDGSEDTTKKATALDFFIAISSISAMVGNRGQAAYAAANTFLDALVQYRRAQDLPAVSLALAAVSDAGYLADSEGGGAERAAEVLRNLGGDAAASATICEAEVLALLRAAVTGETASCGDHVITGVGITRKTPRKALPFWASDAKFQTLVANLADADGAAGGAEGSGVAEAIPSLSPSLTLAEAEDAVCRGLVTKIAQVLMMEPDELDVTRSLSHYPLDSLVAIEIRNFIARQYEASMQVLELLSSGSIQTLSSAVCKKSKLCSASG